MKIKRTGKNVKAATLTKCKISAARAGKTKEVIVLQGNYGYGWGDLVEYEKDQQREARQDLADYRENERNAQHRLIRRRVANPDWSAPTDRFSVLTYEGGFKYKKGKPTKFSDIDEAITYANQLWEDGEEVLLKDSATGCNVQLIPNNMDLTNRNIERFKETVNTDAGIIESSTRNRCKFTVKASKSARKSKIIASHIDNPGDIAALTDYINDVADTMMSVSYAYYNNSEDWEVHLYMDSDEVRSDFMHFIEMKNPTVYKSVIEDPDVIDTYSGDCELYNNGPAYFPNVVGVDIEHGYDKKLIESLKHLRDEYRKYLNHGLKIVQKVLGDFLAPLGNLDIKSASSIRKKRISAKTSKSVRKSKIMAGGVYPEYIENTDDLASVIEEKLKSVTGIDFKVVPESIEYITTRHWVHCEPGWFRMKIMYPIDSRDDYEFLEQISPYMGSDTPIIQKVISDETIRTNSYSDIEIEDSDDVERYYDGLTFDYIDDNSYTFTLDEFNKEQDLIGSKVIEKIYAIHDELAQIISDYVVPDEDDYYDEDDEYIEESTSVGKKNVINAAETNQNNQDDSLIDDLWDACYDVDNLQDIDFESNDTDGTHIIFTYENSTNDYDSRESQLISALTSAGYDATYDSNNGSNVIVLRVVKSANSATDVKASISVYNKSSSEDSYEYYKALADKVVEQANAYFDDSELTNVVYEISDKMLTFSDIAGGRNEVVYIIPLENITPNWDDLESDADELYESMMGSLLPF